MADKEADGEGMRAYPRTEFADSVRGMGEDSPNASGAEQTKPARGSMRPGRRLVAFLRIAAYAGIAAMALLTGGFGYFAEHVSALRTPADPVAADAIIVVTGGSARLEAAVSLLRSGKGERLLISGAHPVANRKVLTAVSGGDGRLFRCCVDIDYVAADTIGNAHESAKWLKDHAYDSAIVVTNNYHMPRTLLELKRSATDIALTPYPVVNTPLENGEWMTSPATLRVLFTEYTKYLAAMARGVLPVELPGDAIEVVTAEPARG